jgi:hypothetical protein
MQFLKDSIDLTRNLSAAAHLIHGSSEGRFRITYCPGHLTKEVRCRAHCSKDNNCCSVGLTLRAACGTR